MGSTPATPQIQPWQTALKGKIHPAAQNAFRLLYDAIQDHDTAIVALNKKVTNTAPSTATPSSSTPSSSGSSTSSSTFPNLGVVNRQSGAAYGLALSDNGGLIVLTFAGSVAVSLASSVGAPFFVSILNLASGSATLTPSTGTVNSLGSLVIRSAGWCVVYFDGTNWWSLALPGILPASVVAVSHQWLNSYSAATGTFTQTQPAIADVSGLSSALGALAPLASPTFTGTVTEPDSPVLTAATVTTSATAGTGSALPAFPDRYLTVSINGIIYKIPLFLP